jgi:DNA polymerase-3 subunit epsilon
VVIKKVRENVMNSIIAIDFETANPKRVSACAVGGCVIRDGEIKETFSTLLMPPTDYFAPINVGIHGITPEMVKDAPTFADIFPTYRDRVENRTVISYSKFDLSVIKNLFQHYGFECDFNYVDVCEMAKEKIPGLKNYKLPTVAKHLGFEDYKHHHAFEDAMMCARVFIALSSMGEKPEAAEKSEVEPFVRFVSSIASDGVIDYKEAYEFSCFLEIMPLTDALKEVKKMLDAVLDDGVVTPMESEKLIGLLKNVAPLAFEDDISAAKVSLV